jgi:uncharacterized repeat protein (TIGR03803 family)
MPCFAAVSGKGANNVVVFGLHSMSAALAAGCFLLCGVAAHAADTETVIYSFGATAGDGGFPAYVTPVAVGGRLFGTTKARGNSACGCGTVFKVNPDGRESTLYALPAAGDGDPEAGLTYWHGRLYGTSFGAPGVSTSGGAVFATTLDGQGKVLHQFGKTSSDGASPSGRLIVVNGTLYGTTTGGGGVTGGAGTVFAISAGGSETVLYRFKGGTDGASPKGGLTYYQGALYGTTSEGGTGCGDAFNGCGTVFKLTLRGKESVLYRFKGGADGGSPNGDLLPLGGRFYGTTGLGGGANSAGTVFSVTPTGEEHIVHAFTGDSDGGSPAAGLTSFNGVLYGTTAAGGGVVHHQEAVGTVFSLTVSGHETVLHAFGTKTGDGSAPAGGLVHLGAYLYGTTTSGGAYNAGTVFRITP